MTFLNVTESSPQTTVYPAGTIEFAAFRNAYEVLRVQRTQRSPGLIRIRVHGYDCISYVTALSNNNKPND